MPDVADLTLSVVVGAGGPNMQNPPPSTIVSPNVYGKVILVTFGDTVWAHTDVTSECVNGVIRTASHKTEAQLIVGIRFYAANLADLWSYIGGTVIPAWEGDDYNVAVTINGTTSTMECGPADHKMGGSASGGSASRSGDLDPFMLRVFQQEMVFTAPRNPVAVTGPNF